MKKDINFLESRKLVSGKKSTNTVAIIGVIMVIVIAVVGFIFAKTKIQIKDYNDQITKLEQEKQNGKFVTRRMQYQKIKNQLEKYLLETTSKDVVIKDDKELSVLSQDLFNAIFDATYEGFEKRVHMSSFTFVTGKEHNIRIDCIAYGDSENDVLKARERQRDFVERLENIKNADGKKYFSKIEVTDGSLNPEGTDQNGNVVSHAEFKLFIHLNDLK